MGSEIEEGERTGEESDEHMVDFRIAIGVGGCLNKRQWKQWHKYTYPRLLCKEACMHE